MKSAHMGQRIYWSEQPTHLGASASQPTLSPLSFLSSPHSQAAVQCIGEGGTLSLPHQYL